MSTIDNQPGISFKVGDLIFEGITADVQSIKVKMGSKSIRRHGRHVVNSR